MPALRSLDPEIVSRLRLVQREKKSGCLRSRATSASRELFFLAGRIVGIRTTDNEERLGNILVRIGRISRQHFDDASIFVRHGWRIGQILSELGILSPEEIGPLLRLQVLEVAAAMLGATGAPLDIDETSALFTTLDTPLSVSDLFMEAARRIENLDLLEARCLDPRSFRPVETSLLTECTSMTTEEAYVLSRFIGGQTAESVFSASGLPREAFARTIFGLVESGILVAEDEPEAGAMEGIPISAELDAFQKDVDWILQRLERRDPWYALELPRDLELGAARDAFRDAIRRYHPDHHHKSDPELRRKLTSICETFTTVLAQLTAALQTQPPVDGAEAEEVAPVGATKQSDFGGGVPAVEGSRSAYNIELYYREAKRALEERDYWRAIELLRVAVQERGEVGRYHFLLAEALSKNPRWRHDAEKSYRRSLELEPYRPEYYEALARLYHSVGMTARAASVVREAMDLGLTTGTNRPTDCQELSTG
jgi:Domain of unknown function (DUF4388)